MADLLLSKNFEQGILEVYNDKPDFDIIQCNQVHSARILEFMGSDLGDKEVDGIIIDPKMYQYKSIAIKTADCLPILLIGEKIAFIHAGWKGLATGILSHPKLQKIRPRKAFIGPSIHHYEVGKEFTQNFPKSTFFEKKGNSYFFNLQAEAVGQLNVNFPSIQIETSSVCTLKSIEYNSYRRDKTLKRNWNIFKLK